MAKEIIIRAHVLFDGKGKSEDKYVIVKGRKIIDVSDKKLKADFEGWVTPAFIDAHSHIGMEREGEPWSESETNDITNQILPLDNPIDSIYFDDRAFKDAVDFGVLYSCVIPGSGNLIGGQAMIIKNFGKNRDEAFMRAYGFKMALGYNPRSTTDWKGERSNTRMGVYALLEKKLDEVIIKRDKADVIKDKKINELKAKYKKKDISKEDFEIDKQIIEREYRLSFSPEDKALLTLLYGEYTSKVHVHKEDDVLYLIHLAQKYKLNCTADHTGDVFQKGIFDKLAKNNIPIVYGPLGSVGYKVELKHAYYQNTLLLMQSKAFYGLMSDHPVIHTITLRDTLKFFMIYGMPEEEAISLITYKNAKILHIDDVLGSVEPDKLASIVVWNKNPLHLGAFPTMVMAEGKVVRKR